MRRRFWIPTAALLALGLVFYFAVYGFRFAGVLLFLAAGVVLAFGIVDALRGRFPRFSRWTTRIGLILVCLGLLLAAGTAGWVVSAGHGADDPEAQWVVVLGAGVNGETPSLTLRTRIDAAAAYLEEHPDVPVVLSGGQGPGEAITEAECMRRALVRRGADESRLYPEERSTSTQENLRYSRAILEELGVDPARRVAIVTSDYHLCRARLMWGGASTAVPAHMPSALYFRCLSVNYYIREAFGLAAYFVYGG